MRWKRKRTDFQAEIEAHLQSEADQLRSEGLAPAEAQAAARRAFGNRTAAEERFYESGRWMFWDHLLRDLRFAVRLLMKDLRFTGLAILGLALGIGISTAIVAVVHAFIAQANTEIQDPASYAGLVRGGNQLSYAEYRHYADHAASFRYFDAYSARESFVLSPVSIGNARIEAQDVDARYVSANFLLSKGLAPALGRSFTAEEEDKSAPMAILNFGFWKRRLGGDESILGKTVILNTRALMVVGIADARYGSMDRADLYLPLTLHPALAGHDDVHDPKQDWLNVGGRLRSGVTIRQAQAEIDVLSRSLRPSDWRTQVYEGGGSSPEKRAEFNAALFAIILTVSMILLIACTNLANLLLARAAVRSREIGVRLSLGASRARLVRQLLTESMLLAIAGGGFGLLLSHWLARLLARLVPEVPNGLVIDPHPDPLVVTYAIILSLGAGLSFGLAPALSATRTSLAQALHTERLSGIGGPRGIWSPRNLLVIVPVAVSLLLLMGAGLTGRYVERTYISRPAYALSHLIAISLRLNAQGYDEARTRQFQQDLRERVARMPGVTAVALAGGVPYEMGFTRLLAGGSEVSTDRATPLRVGYNVVSNDFLETLGVPMERGRAFTASDREGAPPVAIVNRFLARQNWPNQEAVGKRVRLAAADSTWFDVIGVTQDLEDPTEPARPVMPEVYVPYGQGALFLGGTKTKTPPYQMQFLVRASAPDERVKSALRQEVLAADASLRVRIESLEGMLESRLGPMKTFSMLFGALGALALLMASVGIYAILAYAVSQRTREIGIRMALGAHRRQIAGLVMQRTAVLIAWGIGVGFAGVLAISRILSAELPNFARLDGPTCISVALLLGLVALVASYLPARKALRVDPMRSLRWE